MARPGRIIAAYLAALAAALTLDAMAQQPANTRFPVKPLRFVVGLAPGGATDIVARLVGQKLSDALGQQVIVDNRSGAAGSIAGGIVAKAHADGYTLLAVSSSFAINPSLHDLPFDSIRDFSAVSLMAQAPFLLVVNPSLRVDTVKDLVALARAKPRSLLFSSGGTGGSGHLAGEMLKHMTGIDIEHVPYRGGSPALLEVVSGQVHMLFSAIPAALVHARSGRVRALGVTSVNRSKAAPDLPTLSESGVSGYQTYTWYALLAPAGTPPAAIHVLSDAVAKAVRLPDMTEKLLADGAEPVGGTPAEAGRFITEEIGRFRKLARDMGLKPAKPVVR